MTRKTRTWIAGTVFTVGSVAGMALATAGLMPTLDIELAVPAREALEYRPGSVAANGAEDEIVLVYLGSSSCGWSNLPEVSRAVRDAKVLVAASTTMTPTGEDSTSAVNRRFSASALRRRVRSDPISRLSSSTSGEGPSMPSVS